MSNKGNAIQIIRFDTILSNMKGLYFRRLYDNGQALYFDLENDKEDIYRVLWKSKYAYKVSDEEMLTAYWNRTDKKIGSTFIVINSTWKNALFFEETNIGHYVVGTFDMCVEVLSNVKPIITKL